MRQKEKAASAAVDTVWSVNSLISAEGTDVKIGDAQD